MAARHMAAQSGMTTASTLLGNITNSTLNDAGLEIVPSVSDQYDVFNAFNISGLAFYNST